MTTSAASSAYQELKNVVMEVVNDDTKPIGKAFQFLESKTGVRRDYILIGELQTRIIWVSVWIATTSCTLVNIIEWEQKTKSAKTEEY